MSVCARLLSAFTLRGHIAIPDSYRAGCKALRIARSSVTFGARSSSSSSSSTPHRANPLPATRSAQTPQCTPPPKSPPRGDERAVHEWEPQARPRRLLLRQLLGTCRGAQTHGPLAQAPCAPNFLLFARAVPPPPRSSHGTIGRRTDTPLPRQCRTTRRQRRAQCCARDES
jgi:hypothetical protein